jgi:hypothetical protein
MLLALIRPKSVFFIRTWVRSEPFPRAANRSEVFS